MRVAVLSGFTCTARIEPEPPSTLKSYSPSARHVVDVPVHTLGADEPWVLKLKRGSNAFEEFGAIDGKVYVLVTPVLPAMGVSVSVGATAVAPRFCTMIGVQRPAVFF